MAMFGNIYEGEGRRDADEPGALNSSDSDEENANAESSHGPKSTLTAVSVKPTAGVARGQMVVKPSLSSRQGRDRGSGPGVGRAGYHSSPHFCCASKHQLMM